ncbi:MAG: hypothetical protein ACR2QK_07745, partial [Acidimicrobiales bacterium]
MTQEKGIPYRRHKPSTELRDFLDPLDPGSYFDCGQARLHGLDDALLREAESRGRQIGDDSFQLVATDMGLIFCRPSISFAIAAHWEDVTLIRPHGDDPVVLPVNWPTHGELKFTVSKRLAGNVFRRWLQLRMQSERLARREKADRFTAVERESGQDATAHKAEEWEVVTEVRPIERQEPAPPLDDGRPDRRDRDAPARRRRQNAAGKAKRRLRRDGSTVSMPADLAAEARSHVARAKARVPTGGEGIDGAGQRQPSPASTAPDAPGPAAPSPRAPSEGSDWGPDPGSTAGSDLDLTSDSDATSDLDLTDPDATADLDLTADPDATSDLDLTSGRDLDSGPTLAPDRDATADLDLTADPDATADLLIAPPSMPVSRVQPVAPESPVASAPAAAPAAEVTESMPVANAAQAGAADPTERIEIDLGSATTRYELELDRPDKSDNGSVTAEIASTGVDAEQTSPLAVGVDRPTGPGSPGLGSTGGAGPVTEPESRADQAGAVDEAEIELIDLERPGPADHRWPSTAPAATLSPPSVLDPEAGQAAEPVHRPGHVSTAGPRPSDQGVFGDPPSDRGRDDDRTDAEPADAAAAIGRLGPSGPEPDGWVRTIQRPAHTPPSWVGSPVSLVGALVVISTFVLITATAVSSYRRTVEAGAAGDPASPNLIEPAGAVRTTIDHQRFKPSSGSVRSAAIVAPTTTVSATIEDPSAASILEGGPRLCNSNYSGCVPDVS